MDKPLISFNNFIENPYILGKDIKLRPLQKQILLEFWSGNYSLGVWCLGRRSGKTFMAGLSAVYACTGMANVFKQYIRQGEPYYVLFVANNEEQAKIALEQVKLFLNNSPILRKAIKSETATSVTLTNNAIFKAVPNTAKGVRGYSVALAILDEAAHYRTGSKQQTGEQLYQAISPSIAQFGNQGKMLLISTPWVKQGIFYDNYQKGLSDDSHRIHVVNYPTWMVNPTISQEFLDLAKQRDPVMFEVEYAANFSVDFASFFDSDLIEAAIKLPGPTPFNPKFKNKYFLALDPALSGDAFTAVIGHREKDALYVDLFHEFIPSFYNGKKKVVDIAKVEDWIMTKHNIYGFKKVVLDQYQSAGTIQRLSKHLGNKIQEMVWTHSSKIEAYSHLKELVNTNKLFLYFHEKAIFQLKNLQVHYNPSGSWSVSGGSGIQVDDYCSALAALALMTRDYQDVHWINFSIRK